MKTPTTLIIMDGFGLTSPDAGNAVANASTPNLDHIFRDCPGCKLSASGLDVGLPEGQMGNSEVGHTNMGAGRVVFQDLPRITRDIQTGDFFKMCIRDRLRRGRRVRGCNRPRRRSASGQAVRAPSRDGRGPAPKFPVGFSK